MNGFRIMHDHSPVQLVEHVRKALAAYPDLEILVGSDSQNRAGATIYATTVVLRYPGNGAHVIYRSEKQQRIKDLWSRLWGEVERSLAVARALTEAGGVRVHRIDLDLNSDPRYGSNRLHTTAVGYVRAQGYEARTKPDMLIATWAANVLCQ